MYTIIGVSAFAVLLAAFANSKNFKYGLEWSFALLTIFLAIRFDFGNDYLTYLESFLQYKFYSIGLFDFDKYYLLREEGEIIWVLLNLLFGELGFFALVICVTLFENFVIYRFIKQYVSKEWYWLAVFIFSFQASLMLIGASMMRQWLSLCIFVFCIDFIQKGKPIHFFLLMLVATQIHTSSWVLLPIYFVRYLPSTTNKSFFFIAIPLYILWLYIAHNLVGENIEMLLQSEDMNKYSVYLEGEQGAGSITSYIARALFPLICFTQINRVEEKKRLIFLIFGFYLLVLPISEATPMIGRIGTYFYILFMCVFPETIQCFKKQNFILSLSVLLVYILWTLYNYFPFFNSQTFGEYYQNYQTIFSQPWM